jgi:hypothetical protein
MIIFILLVSLFVYIVPIILVTIYNFSDYDLIEDLTYSVYTSIFGLIGIVFSVIELTIKYKN